MALSLLAGAGIQLGSFALDRLLNGGAPDPPQFDDFISAPRSLEDEFAGIQEDQFRKASAALAFGGEQAVESMRASGATGSGLGAGLEGTFQSSGDVLTGILGNFNQQRMSARNQDIMNQQNYDAQRYGAAQQQFGFDMQTRSNKADGILGIASGISGLFSTQGLLGDMESSEKANTLTTDMSGGFKGKG